MRAVIFAHADETVRLGALDFDQLIAQQEARFRDKLNEFRKDLKKVNAEIAAYEEQLNPDVKRSLQELLAQKEKQIEEHKKITPQEVQKPPEVPTPDQLEASTALEQIAATLTELEARGRNHATGAANIARKMKAVQNLRERIRLLERAYRQFEDDSATDLDVLGIKGTDVAVLNVTTKPIDDVAALLPNEKATLDAGIAKDAEEKAKLQVEQTKHNARLNAPQLRYQAYMWLTSWKAQSARSRIGAENTIS